MKEILLDLLIFWAAVLIGVFGWCIGAPVFIFAGVVFVVTSVVWMAMDLIAIMKEE